MIFNTFLNRKLWLCLSFFLCSHITYSQQAYVFKKRLDIGLVLGSATALEGSLLLQHHVKALDATAIAGLKTSDVPAFDRAATRYWSKDIAVASDYFALSSVLLPSYFYFKPETRKQSGKIALVSYESLLFSQVLANVSKLSLRNRPYLYNPDVALENKVQSDARMSFFSAHTTTVSSMCFSFALAYQTYLPEARGRAAVWAGAITLPAIEGYMRVRAGRHFPSDVITGYLVGAGSSYLMHLLHKSRKK